MTALLQHAFDQAAALSADEQDAIAARLLEDVADVWDRRIEADIAAGRLDTAGKRADADFDAGRCAPL